MDRTHFFIETKYDTSENKKKYQDYPQMYLVKTKCDKKSWILKISVNREIKMTNCKNNDCLVKFPTAFMI